MKRIFPFPNKSLDSALDTAWAYPQLLDILDDLHVVYYAQRFPAQHDKEVLVVVPLKRTVSLLESVAIQAALSSCFPALSLNTGQRCL
jgi:hypothetical protein